jgi:hypothetical protein
MLFITREAKQELKKLLSDNGDLEEKSLRIVDAGEGKLELITDNMRPDDEVVEFEGKILLVIERSLATGPRNISLDAYTTSDVHRIVISEEDIHQLSSSVTVNWITFPQSNYNPN